LRSFCRTRAFVMWQLHVKKDFIELTRYTDGPQSQTFAMLLCVTWSWNSSVKYRCINTSTQFLIHVLSKTFMYKGVFKYTKKR
jgi:hypothetical protein